MGQRLGRGGRGGARAAAQGVAGAGSGRGPVQGRQTALRVSQIANCLPRPLYFQIDPLTDESWYYYRIDFPHDGPATKTTFTAAQIAAPAEFKKRLLSSAPLANYTGNGAQLDRLLESQRDRLRVVEAVSFVGYSREHRAYVFNDLAVKDGRVAELNDDDYFDLAPTALKTLDRSVSLDVTPWPDRPDFAWIDHLYLAYGPKGLVALAYWFGSLFAEQLRERHKSWPFLELSGEAQSGKSTLIEFLWKLCGRLGYEGFDPAKASLSGRSRTFSQVGNLPVVLMESDRDDDTPRSKKFDLDELKPFYNGRSIRTSGVRTGGNETREPAFRAAIVIEQNATVAASDAMMQRIVRLEFDGAGYNSTTKRAAEALEVTPLDDVSGFILAAVRAEARVLARIEAAYPRFEGGLMENRLVAHRRLAKNHGQLLACLDALHEVVPIAPDRLAAAEAHILSMAVERKAAIGGDHPVVEQFWEAFVAVSNREASTRLAVQEITVRQPLRLISTLVCVAGGSAHAQTTQTLFHVSRNTYGCANPRATLALTNPVEPRRTDPGWVAFVVNDGHCAPITPRSPWRLVSRQGDLAYMTYAGTTGLPGSFYLKSDELVEMPVAAEPTSP